MKKILKLFFVLSIISTSSISVVSCGTPTGNSIDLSWNDGSNVDDGNMVSNVINPTMWFLNSNKENIQNGSKPNADQISNSFDSKKNELEEDKDKGNLWTDFYNDYYSSKDIYFNSIKILNNSAKGNYWNVSSNIPDDEVNVEENVINNIESIAIPSEDDKNIIASIALGNSNDGILDLQIKFDNTYLITIEVSNLVAISEYFGSTEEKNNKWYFEGYVFNESEANDLKLSPGYKKYSTDTSPFSSNISYDQLHYEIVSDSIEKISIS